MRKNTLKIFVAFFCLLSTFVYTQNTVDLDPLIEISQNVNEKGAVVIKGNFTKPTTLSDVKLTIKYKDVQNNWISAWYKVFAADSEYDENLKATFELPASAMSLYNVKVELSSSSNLSNWQSIMWNKSVSHYKEVDYITGNCELDENQYTILFTPKKNETVLYNTNGSISGVKDRVTSQHLTKKLDNIVLSVDGSGTLDTTNANGPIINITNPNNLSTIVSSQKYIYQGSDTSPFEFSYHDPVYMFAGKFSSTGFFINFSNWAMSEEWGGEQAGRGYLDFTNPNALVNRYFNAYNYIQETLSQTITDQEPVVIVISRITGLRVYKADGSYVSLNATSNYGTHLYGYPPLYDKQRGPGSENFSLSNTSQASLYGIGAIRNRKVRADWNGPSRPLNEIETEINKFINYVGIFGSIPPNSNATEYSNACITITTGAQSDYIDWTKAPNSYIFTGKAYNPTTGKYDGTEVDGLYIPVKKAYAMWRNGGEFMKDESGNYTPIPNGTASAGLYWEDETGLIQSYTLEGSGEDAKIKVLVNKLKEGNAVISYKVNGQVYWTWHVWVTDDPTDGSTYHHGFEKDKEGNLVTDWKWMDRNLGASSSELVGNDWDKVKGLQYQWGRKDPFPTFKVDGEVGKLSPCIAQSNPIPIKFRGNLYPTNNTGFDSPNGNIRYSIKNPIHYIIPPVYIYKIGETPNSNGENYAMQGPGASDWERKEFTTWFSKNKFKVFDSSNYYNNITWNLWGDTRGGKWSHINTGDAQVLEESKRYAIKSPYDPCPCNWRVPSFYSTVDGINSASPWGKIGSTYGGAVDIKPDITSSIYPGIKVYSSFGFDFTEIVDRNLGKIPVNGNYEYYPQPMSLKDGTSINRNTNNLYLGMGSSTKGPEAVLQDQISDGALHSSTFFTAGDITETGTRGLVLVSDPGNVPNHSSVGFHKIIHNEVIGGNTYESRGIRCIKDPNNAYMPVEFETEYVTTSSSEYTFEELQQWAKEPNTYIADATNQNRVIEIPLKKAFAMHKLYLSENNEFPSDGAKSSSIVWTTNQNLISSMEIIDGTKATAILRVTLTNGQSGNAVVAFHIGSGQWVSGNHSDPILWSWHIWASKTPVQESTEFTPETDTNGGIKIANDQFVKPTTSYYGAQISTTLMDRDLGALDTFLNENLVGESVATFQYNPSNPNSASSLRVEKIRNSGGMHYQWGRKDPIPVFYYPGGFFEHSVTSARDAYRKYTVFRQIGINNGVILYSAAVNENSYNTNYTKEYSNYSSSVNANDTQYNKIKKILKYSVANPMTFMYQANNSNSKDWLSNENGLYPDRWGGSKEKSPFDPCPSGWRIPDLMMKAIDGVNLFDGYWSFAKGNSPWFYNAKFERTEVVNGVSKLIKHYGLDPANYNYFVSNENYSINKLNYIGGYVRSTSGSGRPNIRYGFVLNKSGYNIGNFPNNGVRGFNGGNSIEASMADYITSPTISRFMKSGIWTAASLGEYSAGMYFNSEITQTNNDVKIYYLTPTYTFRPQSAMSCRCAKDEPRYLGIPVTPNTGAQAKNAFAKEEIEQIVEKNQIIVFPNPIQDIINIDAKDGKEYYYQIYNMAGQLVKEGKFVNNQTEVSGLSSGTYLIRINNSESVVKIIKQ